MIWQLILDVPYRKPVIEETEAQKRKHAHFNSSQLNPHQKRTVMMSRVGQVNLNYKMN